MHAPTARFYKRLHATLTLIWALLAIPTLIWWKDSILWVALMSLWANMAAHFAAYQGTRAEENNNHE
jgi:hypothetical protein